MQVSDLSKYDYSIEESSIAQKHVAPRDSARLLVVDTKTDTIVHTTVAQMSRFLPANTTIVMNTTTVIPARIVCTKESGGKVEILFLLNEKNIAQQGVYTFLCNKKLTLGSRVYHGGVPFVEIMNKQGIKYTGKVLLEKDIFAYLKKYGLAPLPPYIKHNTQSELERQMSYQTVFSQESQSIASVAAPTASLHFTHSLLEKLKNHHTIAHLQLHVGLGTFASLREENFTSKKLHSEYIEVDRDVYTQFMTPPKNVLAVGTTVARSLESLSLLHLGGKRWVGYSDIFIYPPYSFSRFNMLMTNFHVPRSSLMLLVQAFLEYKGSKLQLVEIYQKALQEGYLFYSLGDAMLIL